MTGRLPHMVTLQASTESPDSVGQPTGSWSDLGVYPARVWPLTGREAANAAQVNTAISHRVNMQYSGVEITNAHRIVFEGRNLYVFEAINVGNRNEEWRLMCTEEDIT